MGRYTYGTPIVRTGGIAELKIGKFYCIGPDVSIHMVSDHHVDWATTYDLMALMDWPDHSYKSEELVYKGNVTIGNDVWIGERTIILPGISIGDGSVIGAGSIVTKSFESYSVIAGNPCSLIRKRFSDEYIFFLNEMRWWDWIDEDIYKAMDYLQNGDINKLYDYYIHNVRR